MHAEIQSNNLLMEEYSRQYSIYRNLYPRSPLITSTFDLTNAEAFEYCIKRNFFVIIAPYNNVHELLLERTFSEDKIRWSLIGGSVKYLSSETFLAAANRLSQHSLPSIVISDIEPFAFIENMFLYEDKCCTHHGIAFTGRIRANRPEKLLLSGERTRDHFVSKDLPLSEIAISHNKSIFLEAVKHISRKSFGEAPFHEREISINETYQHRYAFHDKFVKPIFNLSSNFLGHKSIREYKKLERFIITESEIKSVIDVACGENELCDILSKTGNFKTVVGNDISFSQIELLAKRNKAKQSSECLIYTNHDATDLPFDDEQFDMAICKNVLHHMHDEVAINRVIAETVRISKKSLIVEVMDPNLEGAWGRLRHRYYTDFLKDAFVKFLSQDEFDAAIRPYKCLFRENFRTLRGVYFIAILCRT